MKSIGTQYSARARRNRPMVLLGRNNAETPFFVDFLHGIKVSCSAKKIMLACIIILAKQTKLGCMLDETVLQEWPM